MKPAPEFIAAIQNFSAHHVKPTVRLAEVLLSGDTQQLLNVATEDELASIGMHLAMIHGFCRNEAWGSRHAYNNWLSSGCAKHDGNPCALCGYNSQEAA